MVGSRFVRAVGLANEWHVGQVRKGTNVPYIAHLLAVASLVLEAEGDEDMAIAALLHDSIEDAGVSQARIEREFGSRVSDIVMECTDGTPETKRDATTWGERKRAYIEKLETASHDAIVVSCADKLHNARAIRIDLEREGEALWERFNQTDPEEQCGYYESLARVFARRLKEPRWLPAELERTVAEAFCRSDPERSAPRGKPPL